MRPSLLAAPDDRIGRRFATLLISVALALPSQAVWLATPAAAAAACPSGSTSLGSGHCQVVFTSSTGWTIPANVSSVDVVVVGGGGGGGGNQDPRSSLPGAGGGGGGGQVTQATYQAVTPGATATITVGAGGTGGPDGPGNGTAGGASSFVSSAVSVSAAGGSPGAGGSWGAPYPTGSGYGGASGAGYAGGSPKLVAGGSPTTWETIFGGGGGGSSAPGATAGNTSAGNGGAGTIPSAGLFAGYGTAYAGGGGGGSKGTGGNGSYATSPGQGTAGGGDGNASTTSPGGAATPNTGGGGGGTASFTSGTGGAGGSGLVVVRFLAPGGNWSQAIAFTSAAPSNAVYNGTYSPTASATSGLPVSFSVDGTTSSVCSMSGGVVHFTGVGTCTIDANQAGVTGTYKAAPQVQQSFSVGKASQWVGWTSAPPTNAVVGGTWQATGFSSSGLPVTFVVQSGSSAVCSVNPTTNVVSFISNGYCAITVTQAGNAYYTAATPVLQSFWVIAASGTAQTLHFTTSPPINPTVGGTYTPAAVATSGLTVALTIDNAAASVCSIDPDTNVVTFDADGTCTIDANQAGDGTYGAAPQVQQTFAIAAASAGSTPVGTGVAVIPAFTGGTSPVAVTFDTVTVAGTTSLTIGTTPPAPVPAGYQLGSETYFELETTATYTPPVTVCFGYADLPSAPTNLLHYDVATESWLDITSSVDTTNQIICGTAASLSPFALVAGGLASQTITFTSSAPTNATVGAATYTPTATGGASTSPVVLTVDGSSSAVCAMDGSGVVSFTGVGTCTIDANQAGDASHAAADQAQQSFTVSAATPVLYVTQSDVGAADCSSWANACGSVAQALAQAKSGDEVWVAAGTYLPTTSTNRAATFQLKNGVALYGGFAGTETSLDQRDANPATNGTVLSGDIGTSGDNGDNAYHVVNGSGTNATAVIDGFTVTGGNAHSSGTNGVGGGMYSASGSPTVRNMVLASNTATEGGGMWNGASSPTLTNVTFSANTVSGGSDGSYGGGLANESGSSPTLLNVTFAGNGGSNVYGGGMENNNGSNPTLTNVTFAGNSGNGAAMANFRSSPTVTNATFVGNSGTWGAINYNCASNVTIRNSILWGNTGNYWFYGVNCGGETDTIAYSDIQISWSGTGIIHADPLLASMDYYGGVTKSMAPLPGSPVIDAANSDYCPATDQRGVDRPQGSGCDLGAVEAQPFNLSVTGGDGQSTPVNQAFADPLQVTVTGTGTDPVARGKVTFSAPAGGASATLTGSPATIGTDGTASVTATANSTIGSYTVTASAHGAAATASFDLENLRAPAIYHVVKGGAKSGDCLTWATACELSYALAQAQSTDQLWVAAGTYTPDTTGLSDARSATFQLKSGVAVYGGFGGTETSVGQRNPSAHVSVLSGDIGTAGNSADNAYHVVTGSGTNATAILDGVTVSGGNANGAGANTDGGGMYNVSGSPTVRNTMFNANTAGYYGGAMDNESGSSPTLTNVTFSGNTAGYGGGISNNNGSNPSLTNATFSGNVGTGGAAMANFRSNPTLVNATLVGNSAHAGGAFYECAANLTIRNSILWNNTGDHGWIFATYVCADSPTTVAYSDVQGGYAGTGNINIDPLLGALGLYGGVATTVPLLPGSPAIDAAESASCPASDQRGVTRPQGAGCDMGAFEARPFSLSVSGGDDQSAAINQPFANDLQVAVTASGTDPVAGGKVTFSAPSSGASATFTGNPATVGTDGTASVTATANGTSGSYSVTASAAGAPTPASFSLTNLDQITPTFTFDLSGVTKTYGDDPFSVMSYAHTNSTGSITFALGTGSAGCSVTSTGVVTITAAAIDPVHCIIEASLAADGAYVAAGPMSASLNIARAAPTFTGIAIDDSTYDGSPHAASASVSGVGSPAADLGSASVSYALRSGSAEPYAYGTPTATAPTDAGVYRVTFNYAGSANYAAITDDAHTLTISRAAPDFAFVLPDQFGKRYGDDPFTVAGYASKPADDGGAITFALGSNSAGCTVSGDGTVTITGASGQGWCVITASLTEDTNYLAAGPLSQSFPIYRALSRVHPSGYATYGGKATLTATVTDRSVAALPLAGKTVNFKIGTYLSSTPVGSAITDENGVATLTDVTLPAGYTNAGVYPSSVIGEFAGDANYVGNFVFGDLTVDKAILAITPTDDQSMVYGSTPPTNLDYALVGFVKDETDAGLRTAGALSGQAICSAGVSTSSPVAEYTIACTQGSLTAANYDFIVSTELVSFAVSPATLTVTADDQSRIYGAANPTLTSAIAGFVNGETLATSDVTGSASCTTPAEASSGVADSPYPITCTTGTLSSTNYTFTFVPGSLSVTPATLTVTANAQSVQYSDPLPTLTYTISGFANNETLATSGVTGAPSLTAGVALSSGNVVSAPGTYAISIAQGTLGAANYIFTFAPGTLTVRQEDARAYYTGDALFWGTSATATSATVTLTATIKDITAVTDDPDHDDDAGDISRATVTLVNRDASNAPLAGCVDLRVALVSAGDTTVGTVTCTTTLGIGNSGATPYTIGIVVGGYHTDNTADENTVIDVAAPLTSYFITGGGFLTEASSAGAYAADPGRKANFGFNVKFNKGAKSLQGNVNIIFRAGGHTFQIKSNALTSLGEKPSPCAKASATSPCTATFVSKANLQDITDPNKPVSLGGNLTFQMSMTDYGSPKLDTISFTLYDGSRLLFSSRWDGTRTVEQLLGGGNLSVR